MLIVVSKCALPNHKQTRFPPTEPPELKKTSLSPFGQVQVLESNTAQVIKYEIIHDSSRQSNVEWEEAMLRITKPDGTEEMKKVFILKNEVGWNMLQSATATASGSSGGTGEEFAHQQQQLAMGEILDGQPEGAATDNHHNYAAANAIVVSEGGSEHYQQHLYHHHQQQAAGEYQPSIKNEAL